MSYRERQRHKAFHLRSTRPFRLGGSLERAD